MGVKSKTVREALVFYEDPYEQRWLKALGNNVMEYELSAGEPTNATDSIYNDDGPVHRLGGARHHHHGRR
jgi:hypothetical protein